MERETWDEKRADERCWALPWRGFSSLEGSIHSLCPSWDGSTAWRCLLEWLKDPLGICDLWGCCDLFWAGTSGTSWHLPCLPCSSTEPPGHPALLLGPREDCGVP